MTSTLSLQSGSSSGRGRSGTPPAYIRGRGRRAFTMVEIALCIAVVAFALVAILGVLPTGMKVQRDNREDTIINQEGRLWLEAIRGGARGLDELTNYVDLITVTWLRGTNIAAKRDYIFGNGSPKGLTNTFTNGLQIVSLLSTPKYVLNRKGQMQSNIVTAYVRALTGPASEKPDGFRTTNRDFAFSYQLTSEVVPFNPVPMNDTTTNFTMTQPKLSQATALARSNQWARAEHFKHTTFDQHLTLAWPVFSAGNTVHVGGNRKTFRALTSAQQLGFLVNRWPEDFYYILQPYTFANFQSQ